MRVRTFWYKRLWIFRNLWCVLTDKGKGFSQFGYFADKGLGSTFRDYMPTFLMNGSLANVYVSCVTAVYFSSAQLEWKQ